MGHKSNAFGSANCRAKACGRNIKRAVAIWRKFAVIPTTSTPGDEFHAASARESRRHETDRATTTGDSEWPELYNLIGGHATYLALFNLSGRIPTDEEHIVRSKDEACIVV
jgi:hypothetical protein